jgi:predicted RNA-binding protein YlxR (DUF448 family)
MAQASDKKAGLPRQKHVPQRTCIACRVSDAKRVLVRLVRNAEGGVTIDSSGKLHGRGAYLCHNPDCWAAALKRKALERALRLETLPPESREQLLLFMKGLEPMVAENAEP